MGTVTNAERARQAVAAGAEYLVTPNVSAAVADIARAHGIYLCMGGLTPSELVAARELGADLLKVFPLPPVGGPAYLAVIRGPLGDLGPMLAGGGFGVDEIPAYRAAGAVAFGLGAQLLAPDPNDEAASAEKIRRALAHARGALDREERFTKGIRSMADSRDVRTQQLLFDRTPEIFATDSAGAFAFPLALDGKGGVDTEPYDEIRFVFSVWHPSGQKVDRPRSRLPRAPGLVRPRRRALDEARRDRAGRRRRTARGETLRRLDRAADHGRPERLRARRQRFRAALAASDPRERLPRGLTAAARASMRRLAAPRPPRAARRVQDRPAGPRRTGRSRLDRAARDRARDRAHAESGRAGDARLARPDRAGRDRHHPRQRTRPPLALRLRPDDARGRHRPRHPRGARPGDRPRPDRRRGARQLRHRRRATASSPIAAPAGFPPPRARASPRR